MPDFKPHLVGAGALALLCASSALADLTEFPVACEELFSGANEGTDCMIYHGDDENRGVVFDYSDDGRQLTVLQVTDDGQIVRKSDAIEIDEPGSFPIMRDLNGDGVMEIMFFVGFESDYFEYEIWTKAEDAPLFEPLSSVVMPLYDLGELKVLGNVMVFSERYATEQIVINGLYLDGPDVWEIYQTTISPDGAKSTCEVRLGEEGQRLGLNAAGLKSDCEALTWN